MLIRLTQDGKELGRNMGNDVRCNEQNLEEAYFMWVANAELMILGAEIFQNRIMDLQIGRRQGKENGFVAI